MHSCGRGCAKRCADEVTFPVKKLKAKVFYMRNDNTVSGVGVERGARVLGRPAVFTKLCLGKMSGNDVIIRKRMPS